MSTNMIAPSSGIGFVPMLEFATISDGYDFCNAKGTSCPFIVRSSQHFQCTSISIQQQIGREHTIKGTA
jgi:hypothetical protein